MKKIICLFFASTLCLAVFSQEQKTEKMDKMGKKDHAMKDCVMMKDGKVMVMKGGKNMSLEQDMTLSNGTTVMPDGTVKMKDGTTKMLKEDEYLSMDGKM